MTQTSITDKAVVLMVADRDLFLVRHHTYDLLTRAVEEGLNYGWNRAHKHDDAPGVETIKEYIYCSIMDQQQFRGLIPGTVYLIL